MKPIKIKYFCRLPILLILLLLVGTPIFLWFLIFGIIEAIPAFIVIASIPICGTMVGIGFFLSYGIKITNKRISIIYVNALKFYRWEDVLSMEIGFDNESIWGEIKLRNQSPYIFYFDEFELSSKPILSRLSVVKIKITKAYVCKITKQLSRIDKIRIINRLE